MSASRTLAVSRAAAFAAFDDPKLRKRWLPDKDVVVHKATAPKSVRITWCDGGKSVSVNLWDQGPAKCQVALNHRGLASAAEARRVKSFWLKKPDALELWLEGIDRHA